MRIRTAVLTLVCVLAAAWSSLAIESPHVFGVGEKIGYQLHAKGLYLGDQTVELESIDQLDGRDVYKLRGFTMSSRFMNLFFPVDDKWLVYIDRLKLMPLKLEKDMLEGKNQAFLIYYINQDENGLFLRMQQLQTLRKRKGNTMCSTSSP